MYVKGIGGCAESAINKRGDTVQEEHGISRMSFEGLRFFLRGIPITVYLLSPMRVFPQTSRMTQSCATHSIWPAWHSHANSANLPVIADASHATGRRDLIPAMSRAALVAAADGLMVEVHPDPANALSDGMQSLDFPGFSNMIDMLWGRWSSAGLC
jgi:hypothetical protein